MMRWQLLAAVVCMLGASAARAETRVLVQRLEVVSVEPQLARSLEEAIVLELGHRSGYSAVSPAEVEQAVALVKPAAELGSDDLDERLASIEKKLDVDQMISGKVSALGEQRVIAVSLIDLHTKQPLRRAVREGATPAALLAQMPSLVDELSGQAGERPAFELEAGGTLALAVAPLVARGVDAQTADAMTQILAAELNQVQGVRVISNDDIRAMLQKATLEAQLGCDDKLACVAEIGASLGLSQLVAGTIGKLKNTYVISLQLIDTRSEEMVLQRVLETFDGTADELRHAIKLCAYRLVGVDYTKQAGSIDFTFNVEQAAVRFGARELHIEHNRLNVKDLVPGRYPLRVVADPKAFFPLQTDVYVAPRSANVQTFRVVDRPLPWYGQWWVWTITGVVVAGTATAIVLAATSNPSTTGSGTVTLNAIGAPP